MIMMISLLCFCYWIIVNFLLLLNKPSPQQSPNTRWKTVTRPKRGLEDGKSGDPCYGGLEKDLVAPPPGKATYEAQTLLGLDVS
jgi:hypothetical protein